MAEMFRLNGLGFGDVEVKNRFQTCLDFVTEAEDIHEYVADCIENANLLLTSDTAGGEVCLRSKGTPTQFDLVNFGFANCFCFSSLLDFNSCVWFSAHHGLMKHVVWGTLATPRARIGVEKNKRPLPFGSSRDRLRLPRYLS